MEFLTVLVTVLFIVNPLLVLENICTIHVVLDRTLLMKFLS